MAPGYYWVKIRHYGSDTPEIAHYDGKHWFVTGEMFPEYAEDVEVVSGPIPRP